MIIITGLCLSASIFITPPVFSQSAREIIQRVNNRNDGSSQISRIQLSTCRYTLKNRKLRCAESPRIKVMESVRKDYGRNERDSKSVIIILEPAGEKGIGFLQYDYDEPGKDSDQWMYFSAMGKVKRIVSGSDDKPKTGSFFGTEISYEDMEAKKLDDFTYKKLKEEVYRKRSCWVIESKPTSNYFRKTNYSKSIRWIDKRTYISLKSILFNRQGRRIKRITNSHLEHINGIWVMKRMLVNNLETRRLTVFKLLKTALNLKINDEFLTRRTLVDFAFRERNLKKMRTHIQ